MAGFENDVLLCSNVNFNPALSKPHTGLITTNGQLIIGSTALNAGGTHLNIGVLTSPDSSITIGYSSPNITLQSGSGIGKSFPTDDGTATPSLGILKILGSSSTDYTQSGLVTHSDGTGNEIYLENRLWGTKFVVDPSATIGDRGSYQTITAATAAASSGDVIFIREGTYTEDWTAKAGVSYIGIERGTVTIVGVTTVNTTGNFLFQNLAFQTNGNVAIDISGGNAPTTTFSTCDFTATDFQLLSLTSGFGSTDFQHCFFDIANTGITLFGTGASGQPVKWTYCIVSNSGGSSTVSINNMSEFTFNWSACLVPLRSTGNGTFNIANSILNTFATNTLALDIQGTGLNGDLNLVTITSGSAACLSVAAGCAINAKNCIFDTNGATLVSVAGTFKYAGIVNGGSNQTAAISGAGTITPLEWLPYGTAAASAAASYRGTASFDSSDFNVTDGFVTLNGTGAGQTITGDSGGALAPTAGNWNILGGNGIITSGSGSTLTVTTNGFPTTQVFASGTGATYTTPANCKWIRVRMVGGGGGGAGTGTAGTGNGGNGTASTWSGGSLSAGGGSGGTTTVGGGGGTPSNGDVNIFGGTGGPRWANAIAAIGGYGACSYFGGGGVAGEANGGAGGAGTGYGSGGGGGGSTAVTNGSGAGGGAGAYLEKIITSPAASYTYTVGAAGSAGTAGTSGVAGGAGAPGYIIVEEYYI